MISVVIPCLILNDDLFDQAKKAIQSILDKNTELILVDNGSTVGSDYLQKRADIYVRYPKAIGFGKACNQGIKLASGDYLLICSIDNEYLQGTLEEMAAIYQANEPMIGALCPSMVNKGQAQVDQLFLDSTEGSTFMISRAVYEKVKLPEGLYDERYEHGYYEDADLWKRLELLGLALVRSGHILANHHEGTTNKFLGVLSKYMEINKQKYLEKWKEEPIWRG